jgi:hypothetical protein
MSLFGWVSEAWNAAFASSPAVDWIFEKFFLFQPWPWKIFAQGNWRNFTVGMSIGLSLAGAGLLLLEQQAKRKGQPVPERTARRVGIAFTVVAFLLYFDFFNPNTRYSQYYHRHELYHYYLGSKYFEEIGYSRLYTCTAIAEVELGRGANIKKRRIRDLSAENLIVPTTETYIFSDPGQCKNHFTEQRWTDFKKDIEWFERSARGSYWERMQEDHGYNPPPVWTMEGKLFSNLAPAGDHFFKLLSLIDIGLQLGVVLMLGWAFGWRAMAMATVFWGCNAPANFYWTGGAFLRQDWIFFFMAALCLARKRKFMLSGGALTWSSLLRIFPVISFVGIALVMLFYLIRHRRVHPDHLRFVGGCVVAAGLLIPASILVTTPTAYQDFIAHIRLHRSTPLTNHMGLETMLAHNGEGRMVYTRDDRLSDPFENWKHGRTERTHDRRPLYAAINLALLAWLAWALRRTRLLWIGLAMSVPLICTILNLTCYYYSIFLAPAVMALVVPGLGPAYLALAGASKVLLGRFAFIDDKYTAESYLFFVFGLCMFYAYSRPFSLARLRAWWEGKPEPKEPKRAELPPAAPHAGQPSESKV